jgi:predicted AlkP superfamily phosphohydrolase/phosphomutase
MNGSRVLMIGLDGFELSIADDLIGQGRMPVLERIRRDGANFLLDHGPAKRTGLTWDHVSSGLAPELSERWAAVEFDRDTYQVQQAPARGIPFPTAIGRRCVAFDVPYFDLANAAPVQGVANWGAHDPGVPPSARPDGLLDELTRKFGEYPAAGWIYGFTWPSAAACSRMGTLLEGALEVRAAAAEWLFAERLPDWDLGIIVISEFHSALEAFWHGVDPDHPLHQVASAEPARRAVEAVYEAADRLFGRLVERFPDAEFVFFSMHGMGPNRGDVANMILLPELMYRHSFKKACVGPPVWPSTAAGIPMIGGDDDWSVEIDRVLPRSLRARRPSRSLIARVANRLLRPSETDLLSIDWMPAARYRRYWPNMPAFAVPAYIDGRIRINLKGRESRGIVDRADYDGVCDEIEALVAACVDPVSGKGIAASIERSSRPPEELSETEVDLTILWQGTPLGIVHPKHGTIGPFPYRRPGGHTGKTGAAWFLGPSIRPGHYGSSSSFDVVPTVIDLLGARPPAAISGCSLHDGIVAEA